MLLWHCMKQTRVGRYDVSLMTGKQKKSEKTRNWTKRVDAGRGGKVEMIGFGGHRDEEEEGAVKRQTEIEEDFHISSL